MEMTPFLDALSKVFGDLEVLAVIFVAAVYGLFIGAIPGLTATMAVALIVPLTLFLDPIPALAAIVTLEACAIFAGDIPNALVRIPGTPSSAAYTADAYALTLAGRHEQALGTSLVFSVLGGLFGAIVLMSAAPTLANVAFYFTTYEYFWLAVLGLSCAAVVSRSSRRKGAIALLTGLALSTIGLSDLHDQPRFTFGLDALIDGVHFIPAMIGLFGVSEVFRHVKAGLGSAPDVPRPPAAAAAGSVAGRLYRGAADVVRRTFSAVVPLVLRRKLHTLRSMLIGTFVGILPGAGADIGAWVSFAISKRTSRRPGEYGRGSLEGLADATAANNAALGGAWVPSLVFGIPGDSVTAIMLGVLLIKNVKPGPDIFETQPDLIYSIYLTFIAANMILLPLGFVAIKAGGFLVRIPRRVLFPIILFFCAIGAYALHVTTVDVYIMLVMGVLGFFLEERGIPLGPVVLGLILGDDVERYFIQSMTKSDGSLLPFFNRPIAGTLGLLCILTWVLPVIMSAYRRRREPEREPDGRDPDSGA